MENTFTLTTIGKLLSTNNITITIKEKYLKAVNGLENFSHIHLYYLDDCLQDIACKISTIDKKKGIIICIKENQLPFNNNVFYDIVDIKPIIPCEDVVKIDFINKSYSKINHTPTITNNSLNQIGLIRNISGQIFLDLYKNIDIKQNDILKIFWWFNHFDNKEYRSLTECNPPYENAPRTGIFATRSPVRPTPLAVTIVKVQDIDKEHNRYYINGIEAFDKTPLLGIVGYDPDKDLIIDPLVPKYLSHWPKYLDLSNYNDNLKSITTHTSILSSLLNEKNTSLFSFNETPLKQTDGIEIVNARENNLKNISVTIPYNKITAVVGVSGSGKSSLVADTIYRECQRKMEYLNHNRNLLTKPNVDYINGAIPAILINQNPIRGNTFSTVGTYVNAYDYLRIIYSIVGIRHCPNCGNEIIPLSVSQIKKIVNILNDDIYTIYGNKCIDIDDTIKDDGAIKVIHNNEVLFLQTTQKCYHCDKLMFELSPQTFSFLNPEARCPICNGTGEVIDVDIKKLITNPKISLLDGAIAFYGPLKSFITNPNANWMKGQVIALAKKLDINLNTPWENLPSFFTDKLLYGDDGDVTFDFYNKKNGRSGIITRKVEGLVNIIKRMTLDITDPKTKEKYFSSKICPTCNGERLNKEGRMVTLCDLRYPEASALSFSELKKFCMRIISSSKTSYEKIKSALDSLMEICSSAEKLGIDYLSLSQPTNTLSSGERERLKLLGAYLNHLSHILYIFDEPSKGLDPRDYHLIYNMLDKLKKDNNTIIMVEHNEAMIKYADNIIEVGPKAGVNGGLIVDQGSLQEILHNNKSELSKYLSISKNYKHRNLTSYIHLENLCANNLKNISIDFPTEAITSIYGVSGSGKSTLLKQEIYPAMIKDKRFADCILVDSQSIGRSSKSVIATYIGIMDDIRDLFANTQDSKDKGLNEQYFSFNHEKGKCQTCKGDGRIEVSFFQDSYITCPDCLGKRYNKQTLKIKYKDKDISEILALSISEALLFFEDNTIIKQKLLFLGKVGLGYLNIGQATSTLSGGEASRLKLAKELMKGKKKNTLYLLDEPTTGLHFSDIDNLIVLLDELSKDNTIIAIEHNKQFLKASDYLIEIGPKAGINGGKVIYQGKNNLS